MSKEEILKKYRELSENEDRILQKMQVEHKKSPYTVANIDDKKSEICFVFSCPGREELIKNLPCQGSTGDNLNNLLSILSNKRKDLFFSSKKDDYDILNATTIVHFKNLDGKTEGSKKEISKGKIGIEKYIESNPKLKYVIFFGGKAKSLEDVFEESKVIESVHLGYQAINQINKDENGEEISSDTIANPKKRTMKRLEIVAERILQQIKDKESKNT